MHVLPGGTKVVNDPCMISFLAAASDDEAWTALDALLVELGTVARDTITRHLTRTRVMADHIDDVQAEVRVKLTQKLWSLRAGAGEPIENIRAYTSTTAERTCYVFLRRQFPQRTRLRNRVRYAITHHSSTTLEEDAQGIWRCRSTAVRFAAQPGSMRLFLNSPERYAADRGIDRGASLPALVVEILDTCDEPVEFDRLVDALAALLGVSDAPPVTDAPGGRKYLDRVIDPAAPINALLEQRASLEQVWKELLALPVRQRSVLLLNLRDPDGGAMLQQLPATAVVTRSGIASALEVSEEELNDIWNELPLDDLTIAARLGTTRQQVINLRKSARARLSRRLGRNQS